MCIGGGGGGGGATYADMEARRREDERKAAIAEGQNAIDAQFSKFDDGFFDNIRKAYLEYANPQFNRQAQEARQQLEFALARAGLGRSTVGAKQRGDLTFDIGTRQQEISDKADATANEQRGNVAAARQSLVGQLSADANAGAAAGNAAARAATLAAQPAFSPIGELFGSVARNLSLAAQGEGIVPAGGSAATGGSNSARLFQRLAR